MSRFLKPQVLCSCLAALLVGCSTTPPNRFEQADTDRDGQLDVRELEVRLSEALHSAGDANQDGTVTLEEWKVVYPKANAVLFRKYDTDKVAGLSLQEAVRALDGEDAFEKLMSRIDTNGDEVIDPQEAATFHEAMEAADGQNNVQKLLKILKS